jgi:ABC-2 type transport system ATP-binding protein
VALGRLLLSKPDIVLLDEPINAIDGEGVEQIRQLILGLRDENRVVLVACHDKEEMQLLADDIICMQQGRIVEKG